MGTPEAAIGLLRQFAVVGTTSGQLNISNPRGGVKPITKTANKDLVAEYMDRAQGPTVDF